MFPPIFFQNKITKLIVALIGIFIVFAYHILFIELEEYKKIKPEYNFNEFLDALKNKRTGNIRK